MHAGRIIMCGCTGAKGLHTGEVYLPFDALVIGPRLEVLDLARLGVRDDPQHIREACAAIATLAGLQHERVEPLLRKFIQQGAAGGCHQRQVGSRFAAAPQIIYASSPHLTVLYASSPHLTC